MSFLSEVAQLIGPTSSVGVEALPTSTELATQLVAIRNPQNLTSAARARLFALTLPYTAAAFLEKDPESVSAENKQDYVEHTWGGDGVVCVAGEICSDGLRLYAHANFSMVSVTRHDASPSTVLYLNGVCSDPQQQGKGIATLLLEHALPYVRGTASYFALRTMNLSVMKITKRVCPDSVVYPLDSDPTIDIVAVATGLGKQLHWASLIAETLVIPRAYPPFLIPVFNPQNRIIDANDAMEIHVTSMLDRTVGDALVCIVELA